MDTILVAIDFSEPSINALNYASHLASYFGAKLIVLHSYSPPLNTYETAYLDQAFFQVKEETEKLLKGKKEELQKDFPNLEVETSLSLGFAYDNIRTAVKEKDVDLLVLGITGSGGFIKKKIIGSTTVKAAKRLDIPLVIVPENATYKPIKKIAYACDYLDEKAVRSLMVQVKLYAALFHAEVQMLNVISETLEAEKAWKSSETKHFVETKLSKVGHSYFTVKSPHVIEGIQEYLKEEDSDLLVMNPLHHGIFYWILHEEVTPEIAFTSPIPILILHQ